MPQRRLSAQIAQLRGSYKANPQRRRPPAPEPEPGVGAPPETLSQSAQLVWHELVGISAPGVLTKSDRPTLELTALLLDEFRQSEEPFITSRLGRLESLLSRLGLSPTDRARVAVPARPEPNPFDELD